MGFLQDRKILVTGLLSNRSIAYGIARALSREGATLAFTYQHADLRGRVEQLAQEFGSTPVLPCDVASDAEITALFAELGKQWNGLDGIVHSIAFAPRETLKGEFLDNNPVTRILRSCRKPIIVPCSWPLRCQHGGR